jgi:hypothetical protein
VGLDLRTMEGSVSTPRSQSHEVFGRIVVESTMLVLTFGNDTVLDTGLVCA